MPGRNEHDWSREEVMRLRILWAEGNSLAEIGRRLGVSKNSVAGKAHRLGLPKHGSPIRRDGPTPTPKPPPPARAGASTLPPLPSLSNDT